MVTSVDICAWEKKSFIKQDLIVYCPLDFQVSKWSSVLSVTCLNPGVVSVTLLKNHHIIYIFTKYLKN